MRTSATTICALATLVFPIGGCRQASTPEPRQQLDSHVQERLKRHHHPRRFEVVAKANLGEPDGSTESDVDQPPPLLAYPCWAAPILSHGLLYVRGKNRLVCMEVIPE